MSEEEQIQGHEIKTLLKVWLTVLLSLSYAYMLTSKLPKGKLRLISLLPIFTLFTLLPLTLSTPTTTGLSGFFFTWLANFKLLLFCFNLGPLSQDHLPTKTRSFLTFTLIAAFPIIIKRNDKHPCEKDRSFDQKVPLNLWSKLVIYCSFFILAIFSDYNKKLHPNILLAIYCCLVYLVLEIVLGLYNKLLTYILGIELWPPFNEPYLSTSLQDFWGKRWNLIVSNILRHTVYLPVRAFLERYVGKKWGLLPAMLASFVVSGLMHELIFYYITRVTPTWEVTCFFLLHGVCLVLEIGLKRAFGLGRDGVFHWVISGPLTVGFVMGTGFWLFLPQLVRNKVDAKSLEEVRATIRFLKGVLGKE